MLMDMAAGIELEIRRSPEDVLSADLIPPAVKMLEQALKAGALDHPTEWFNDDDNFSRVLQETLYLQRALIADVSRLHAALEKPRIDLRGWRRLGPSRVMLLAGWIACRPDFEAAGRKTLKKKGASGSEDLKEVLIDLRNASLTPDDGVALADLLKRQPHVAVDVRENESLGEVGTAAMVDFMLEHYARPNKPRRTICGVTHDASQLSIPLGHSLPRFEAQLVAAELVAGVFAEGIAASMGTKEKFLSLNRVSTAFRADWLPLVWAARNHQHFLAVQLLENISEPAAKYSLKVDVNQPEAHQDHKTALHWTGVTGDLNMLKLFVKHGADLNKMDKHGNTVLAVAEKKRQWDVINYIKDNKDTLGVAAAAT